jgi:tetratricopeptide (TPR) repeat protein
LFESGEKEQARDEFIKVLSADPDSACASAGLESINAPLADTTAEEVERLCTRGDELESRDLDEEAVKAYQSALEKDPSATCALDGLDAAVTSASATAAAEAKALCDQGEILQAADRDDDALTAYKSALGKDASAPCAKTGLEELEPDGVNGWVEDAKEVLADIGVAAAIAAGVLLVLLIAMSIIVRRFDRLYRWLTKFRPIAYFIGPRLTLSAFDSTASGAEKVGAPFTARVQEALQRFRADAVGGADDQSQGVDVHDYDLDVGTGTEHFAELVSGESGLQNSLDKVSEIGPQTKVIAALLDLLSRVLPIRRLKVAGVMDPPDPRGASIVVSLEKDSRLEAAGVITGPELTADPTAIDYLRLAEPAAVWIQYEVARAITGERQRPGAPDSYSRLREGVAHQIAGQLELARDSYREAIEFDRTNWAAHVNLSVVEARLGNFQASIDVAAEALADMIGETQGS